MFQPWRTKLHEARQAYQAQRLDEARELLCRDDLREYLPAKKLIAKVADGLAQRGRRNAELGQTAAGWRDLEAAVDLGAGVESIAAVRGTLLQRAMAEAESDLAADNPKAAVERLEALQRRGHAPVEVRQLIQVAEKIGEARRWVREGNFDKADAQLASAAQLRPDLAFLQQRRNELRSRETTLRALRGDLHDALTNEHWSEAASVAERLLEIVPGDEVATIARRRAWSEAGMTLNADLSTNSAAAATVLQTDAGRREDDHLNPRTMHKADARYLMWIDGVGGFLVCESSEIVLGPPVPGSRVDLPILGDVSRNHATIRRCGEGYVIQPRRKTVIDGREIQDATTLRDGSLIELGEGVRLRFRQPHPLSRTARLEYVSHHRTEPPSDGAILLAESCILGPAPNSHVVCGEWSHDVILYRQDDTLYCRANVEFEIDGASCHGQGPLHRNSHVVGEEFSLTLEAI